MKNQPTGEHERTRHGHCKMTMDRTQKTSTHTTYGIHMDNATNTLRNIQSMEPKITHQRNQQSKKPIENESLIHKATEHMQAHDMTCHQYTHACKHIIKKQTRRSRQTISTTIRKQQMYTKKHRCKKTKKTTKHNQTQVLSARNVQANVANVHT